MRMDTQPRPLVPLGQAVNRSKQKGTAAETAVVRYLRTHGWPDAHRHTLNGAKDIGDIDLGDPTLPPVVIEIKDVKTPSEAAWLAEVDAEMRNKNAAIGVVWWHRPGKANPGDWWVTMRVDSWVALTKIICGPIHAHTYTVSGGAFPHTYTVSGGAFLGLLDEWRENEVDDE